MQEQYKVKKIKIQLSKNQKQKVLSIFGGLREICNLYLEECSLLYNEFGDIPDYRYFDKKINNQISKSKPWLKETSSKARKEYLKDVYQGFKKLIKTNTPIHFKSRKNEDIRSFFFIKDGVRFIDEKHIWIPILHDIKLCEIGYLTESDIKNISSGRIIKTKFKDEYFVSFKIRKYIDDLNPYNNEEFFNYLDGLGIDLNIQNHIVLYGKDNQIIPNPYFTRKTIKKSLYKIKNISRGISLKYETNKNMKGGTATTREYKKSNINKLRAKRRKYYAQISNSLKDHINKMINFITVRTKPAFIVIEDLKVNELLTKDKFMKKLHKNLSNSLFRYFRDRLTQKCDELGIELRLADKYFASSKICSSCGYKKKSLSLSERTYHCKKCGLIIDRDINAAKNLYNLKDYSVLTHNESRIAVGYTGFIDLAEMLDN